MSKRESKQIVNRLIPVIVIAIIVGTTIYVSTAYSRTATPSVVSLDSTDPIQISEALNFDPFATDSAIQSDTAQIASNAQDSQAITVATDQQGAIQLADASGIVDEVNQELSAMVLASASMSPEGKLPTYTPDNTDSQQPTDGGSGYKGGAKATKKIGKNAILVGGGIAAAVTGGIVAIANANSGGGSSSSNGSRSPF